MKRKSGIYGISALLLVLLLFLVLLSPGEADVVAWAPEEGAVLIDAGHGGIDGGAVGAAGTLEKDLNLAVAKKYELLLTLFGVPCTMTRTTDTSLDDGTGETIARRKADDIKRRVSMANTAALLVSIHMNFFQDPKYWGTQTFYSKNHEDSPRLAEQLQTAARTLLAPDNTREIKPGEDSIYLLRNVTVPAVIVECGFLSNPEEEARLNTASYQSALAAALCAGTLNELRSAG